MSQWYMADKIDGRAIGPVSGARLKQLASANQLLPTDMVMPVGGTEWVQASSVKGLFPSSSAVIPSGKSTGNTFVPEQALLGQQGLAKGGIGRLAVATAAGLVLGMFIGAAAMYLVLGTDPNPSTALAQAVPESHPAATPAHDPPRILATPDEPQPLSPPIPPSSKDVPPPIPSPEKGVRPSSPPQPEKEAKPSAPLVPPPAPAPPPGVQLPADQLEFIKQIESFNQRYQEAPNELAQKGLFAERDEAIRKVLPRRSVTNWVGTLTAVTLLEIHAPNGVVVRNDIQIRVQLAGVGFPVTIRTKETEFDSRQYNDTRIGGGTALSKRIAQIRKGEPILVSGEFVPGEGHYFSEVSYRESTNIYGRIFLDRPLSMQMTQPQFLFHFKDLTKP